MSDQRESGIAWTDQTWNPVRGCTRVSPGCVNCYAERVAARFSGPGAPYEGLASMTSVGPRWSGQVRVVEEHLADPLRWRRPRRVFVNSMSDLFHESLSDEEIDRVFAVMALAPQHTFQVLTKRSERMSEYSTRAFGRIADTVIRMRRSRGDNGVVVPLPNVDPGARWWPLLNVWLGVSVEDQQRADERIPHLLSTPAAVRFLSVEPMLGPVEIGHILHQFKAGDAVYGWQRQCSVPSPDRLRHCGRPPERHGIDWVIVGGESGPGARPCDVAWVRGVVEQCRAAGVACFVKQLGARPVVQHPMIKGALIDVIIIDRRGGDPEEWPSDLRVREFPKEATNV